MAYQKTLVISIVVLLVGSVLTGCDRLSEKDKMEMIAKCDSEARKKIKERSDQGRYPRGGDWYEDTRVSTHYSFSEKRCFALEETSVVGNSYSQSRTLYDGLTKKQLVSTFYRRNSGRSEEFNSTSNSIGLTFKADTDIGRRMEADSEIDRLMNLP